MEVLKRIADLAAGDARIAIQTLRYASYNAEIKGKQKIEEDEVKQGFEKASEIKRKYILQRLGKHYQLIYEIVRENAGITSGELFSIYRDRCKKLGLSPISNRSISNYIKTLQNIHLIKTEKAGIRGNVRKFYVSKDFLNV